jgi:hypothetical protein
MFGKRGAAMSKLTDVNIKALLGEIQADLGPALPELDAVRRKLDDVMRNLPDDVNGEAGGKWEDLGEAEKNQFHEQLASIRRELGELSGDPPTPGQKGWLLFYASVMPVVFGALIVACVLCGEVVPTTSASSDLKSDTEVSKTESDSDKEVGKKPEKEADAKGGTKADAKLLPPRLVWVILMVILLGAFGGCLRLISSLVLYLGESGLRRSWLPYYYVMPLVGGMLAPIVCLLLLGGILDSDAGSKPLVGQYLYFYALAAFSGLFASNVLRKLGDVADALFTKPSVTNAGR